MKWNSAPYKDDKYNTYFEHWDYCERKMRYRKSVAMFKIRTFFSCEFFIKVNKELSEWFHFFKMAVRDIKLKKPKQRMTGTKRKQLLWYSTSHAVELVKDWFSVTEKAWKHFYCIKMCSVQKKCDFQMLIQDNQTRILLFKLYLICVFLGVSSRSLSFQFKTLFGQFTYTHLGHS